MPAPLRRTLWNLASVGAGLTALGFGFVGLILLVIALLAAQENRLGDCWQAVRGAVHAS